MAGLLDRCDLGGAVIEDLLPDLLWYTYHEYILLRQRSIAWNNGDSTAIIRRLGQTEVSQDAPNNMLTLMSDHVVAKGTVRLPNQRKSVRSISGSFVRFPGLPDGTQMVPKREQHPDLMNVRLKKIWKIIVLSCQFVLRDYIFV